MILEKVKKYIADNRLFEANSTLVVGLSGGADSVALVHILHRLGYTCVAAHCNFHLRNDESDRDAAFAQAFCLEHNIPFQKIDFDTSAYAKEHAISIEMAARELRYTWFEQLRSQHAAHCIAVAHHNDDQVETILLNLIRGTGIRGLSGMKPRNGNIVRPLLCLSREEVMAYIHDERLRYVTDSSNNETVYTRNKIRLQVIPLLETLNPSVKESIRQTSEYLRQTGNVFLEAIAGAKKQVFEDGKISISELRKQPEPEIVLHELLNPYGFNSATIHEIYASLDAQSGKLFLSPTYQLLKDRHYLILSKKNDLFPDSDIFIINEEDHESTDPIRLKIGSLKVTADFKIERSKNIVYLDKQKITCPLTLRHWRDGDWFIPFGMKGKKKISDYFSDNKFSLFDKQATWLLCCGESIAWVVGHRGDERYRITDATKDVLKIEFYPE